MGEGNQSVSGHKGHGVPTMGSKNYIGLHKVEPLVAVACNHVD